MADSFWRANACLQRLLSQIELTKPPCLGESPFGDSLFVVVASVNLRGRQGAAKAVPWLSRGVSTCGSFLLKFPHFDGFEVKPKNEPHLLGVP